MADLDALKAALSKIDTDLVKTTMGAFLAEAELMKEDSMENCPTAPDGGVLRASHEILGPVKEGNEFKLWIQVGAAADDYAQAVHEHLSGFSPPSWQKAESSGEGVQFNVGGPKFLENAVRKALPGLDERVASRVASRMSR